MSLAQEAQHRAREIRARLIHPPNAVPDIGIDLHRIPPGMRYAEKKRTEPEPVLEYRPNPPEPVQLSLPFTNFLVPFRSILEVVAQNFGLGVRDLMGPSRRPKYTRPRHIAIYLATRHTDLSAAVIGLKLFRDHSTILHGKWKIEELVINDSKMATLIRELEGRLSIYEVPEKAQ